MRHSSRGLIGMTASLVLLLSPAWALASTLEIPGNGATVSGIGVISGWKCEAEGDITVRFDDEGDHIPTLYEFPRGDTSGSCGDANNGFVTYFNWAILSEGEHTAVAYDDEVEFARSTFSVATLGEEFVVGAAGECTIPNFPSTGESATFAWNQSTQHLELVPEVMDPMEPGLAQLLSLALSAPGPLTSIGETADLLVTGTFDDGSRQSVDGTLVDWKSSDEAVATVSAGVVTAVRGGNATITAIYEENTAKLVISVWISTLSEGSVRVLYVVPADREFRDDYSDGISKAIVDVQGWYRRQLDGLTFDIYSVIPEQCHLPGDEEYYSYGDVWVKILEDVQPCAPVQHDTSRFTWALYVDAEERCGEPHELGRGGDGITMMGSEDLEGLSNPGLYSACDGGPWEGTLGRWMGGTAHELGHTFGLPHPPGCDEGLPTCDYPALMSDGYGSYPDTYFRDDEKVILRRSPFIKR